MKIGLLQKAVHRLQADCLSVCAEIKLYLDAVAVHYFHTFCLSCVCSCEELSFRIDCDTRFPSLKQPLKLQPLYFVYV